jgi:hypothetical protein
MTLDRILCAIGFHDSGEPRHVGYRVFRLCRREGCARYAVRRTR